MILKIIAYLKLHPFIAGTVRFGAIFLGILLVVLLYVAVIGVSIDTSKMRGEIAATLSKSLGREVGLEGALQLEISAHPKLKIGGMHIANAAGFEGGDFASLGEVRLALDLWPLLRLRFQVEELSGSDVRIRLQLKKNGQRNWTFNAGRNKKEIAPPAADSTDNLALESFLARLDIKRVALKNLDVEFIAANSKSHFFELQSLLAQLPAGEPMTLSLNGTIEKTHPYRLDFTGGTIADMIDFEQPWPIDLRLNFLSSQLLLKGVITDGTGTLNFALGTQDLREFEQLLQSKFPAVGATNLTGMLNYAAGTLSLDKLDGHMGRTTLKGALHVDYTDERPKLQGELALPVLDLRPFMLDQPAADAEPAKGLAEVYRDIARANFSLKALNSMDANVSLRVGRWLNLPGAVHDASLQIKLERGRLTMPMQLNVADVKLSGGASVDARVAPAKFKFSLAAHNTNIGNLGGLLLGMPDVQGRLSRFDWRVEARGDRGAELMDTLDVRMKVLNAKLHYGHKVGERPVQFSLDNFELALPAGKDLRGELQGALLDKRFKATLRGGSLYTLAREETAPLDLEMQAGSARAKIHALVQTSAAKSASDISFYLAAPHSGEIASWLGLKPGADAPISLHGVFHASHERWHLADFSLQLGRSDLSADMLRSVEQGRSLIKLQIKSELLDVEQLQSLLPESDKKASAATQAASSLMDIPILPAGISLADADVAVNIKRIVSASAIAVNDVQFLGQIRDGMMPVSPFSAGVAGNNFAGAILLDLRTQQPHSVIWISAEKFELGSVLQKLGIASNIASSIDYLSLQLDLHSSHLGSLLAQSEMLAVVDGGHITLADANTGSKMNIALDHGELKSAAGSPVQLDLLGSLNSAPVSIAIKTATAADLVNPNLPIPFQLNATTSGATIKLAGEVERPFSKNDMELALDMSGSRFDNLNALTRTSLPPWGPWQASGKFTMSAKGYEVSALKLQVGSSQLTGYGKLDTQAVPPRLDIALTAPGIQLDDFRFGNWSPEKSRAAEIKPSEEDVELSRKVSKASLQTQQLLSPEVLTRQNAYLSVRVEQVVSGKDVLGSGKLNAQLENGRAAVGPVLLNTPGGSASFLLKYEPGKNDVLLKLRAEAKHFDYGILARRIDRNSEMSGIVSLDVDVSSRAQYLSDIFRQGKGYVDFSIWPENLKSGLLDVWAVNVLMALLPAVDSSNESKVNCAIGRFVLADGKLSDKSILIDTSRMRVSGKGAADFTDGTLQFYIQPRAKTPQFLSLAIPIELNGTFDDFKVGVRTADVMESVGQFATSLIWVPLKMLFGKETPVDGRDVCEKVVLH